MTVNFVLNTVSFLP